MTRLKSGAVILSERAARARTKDPYASARHARERRILMRARGTRASEGSLQRPRARLLLRVFPHEREADGIEVVLGDLREQRIPESRQLLDSAMTVRA